MRQKGVVDDARCKIHFAAIVYRRSHLVRLPGNVRFGALVIAVVLAGLALRLAWGLHGTQTFGLGFDAQAQETAHCPDRRVVDEFIGYGAQLTDDFDTTRPFRVTYDLRSTGREEPSLNVVALDEDGVRSVDALQTGEGAGETRVNDSPGTYYLDIDTTGDADYTVSVEQCENDDAVTGSSEQDDSTGRFTQTAQRSQPAAGDDTDAFIDDLDETLDEDLDDSENPDSPDEDPDELDEEENGPPARSSDNDQRGDRENRRTLLEAGGTLDGPAPELPGGGCPAEFPVEQGNVCYR
jgi:hypothetical protein